MADKTPSEIDLNLHLDPAEPKALDTEIAGKLGPVELDANIQLDPDGKPAAVTIGVKIPIP